MKLILPEFVKTIIMFLIMILIICIISSIYIINISINYFPYLIMENIFFSFNVFFILFIAIMAFLYPYADDIVIYLSVLSAIMALFLSLYSIYYNYSEFIPFTAYMVFFIGIVLHKKRLFE